MTRQDIASAPSKIGIWSSLSFEPLLNGETAVSDNSKDNPGSGDHPVDPKPEDTPKLGRRLFLFRAGALLGGAVATLAGGSRLAEAQGRTDRDPIDSAGRGRGVTDRDPTDRAGRGSDRDPTDRGGRGRGHGRTDRDPTDSVRRGRGVTDRDPTDRAGRGSDADPVDRVGRGRGSGRTDSDPTDAAGRGRR